MDHNKVLGQVKIDFFDVENSKPNEFDEMIIRTYEWI